MEAATCIRVSYDADDFHMTLQYIKLNKTFCYYPTAPSVAKLCYIISTFHVRENVSHNRDKPSFLRAARKTVS